MLTLAKLGVPGISDLYESRMRQDFPPSELKYLSSILAMVARDEYDVICAYEGEEPVAYALMYRPKNDRAVLLDYLAVYPQHRGRGVGTAMLAQLRDYYQERADVMMIECERPKSAPDETEARKRIRFYTQAGAELTDVRIWLFDVEYSILVLSCRGKTPKCDWAQQMLRFYRQMLPASLYESKVRLIRG